MTFARTWTFERLDLLLLTANSRRVCSLLDDEYYTTSPSLPSQLTLSFFSVISGSDSHRYLTTTDSLDLHIACCWGC